MRPCSRTGACCGRAGTTRPGTDAHVAVLVQSGRHGSRALLRRQQPHDRHATNTRRSSSCIRTRCRTAASWRSCASTPTSTTAATWSIIDGTHYVENTQALLANAGLNGPGADARHPEPACSPIPGPSPGGRFNSAYPLWDGTQPHPGELDAVPAARHHADAADDRAVHRPRPSPIPSRRLAPPLYSVWMFDPAAEHPAADHAAGRGRHDDGRRRGAAARRCRTSSSTSCRAWTWTRTWSTPASASSTSGASTTSTAWTRPVPNIADARQSGQDHRQRSARRASSAWRRRCRFPTRRS